MMPSDPAGNSSGVSCAGGADTVATNRSPTVTLPAPARRTLRNAAGWAAWIPVAVLTLVFALGISVPERWRYVPLLASVVLFGLPHGAVDWVALPRAVTGRVTPRWVGAVSLLYLVLGAAYVAVWFLAPVPAAVVFVVMTWFHWGQGDLHPLVTFFEVDYLDTSARQGLTVLIRGGLPMLVPLFAFPSRYRAVIDSFVAPFGADLAGWPCGPRGVVWLAAGFAALTLLALVWGYLASGDRSAWAVDAAETALLWAFFLTVPPVLAVGTYFCCWHSLRHVLRVLTLERTSRDALTAGRLGPGLRRFALEAALPILGALLVGVVLWLLVPDPSPTLSGLTALYLVAIAVLTLPHVAVVTWLDRVQGLW